MILVTGSTGHLGSATIEHLLKNTAAKNIIAFARNENKAKLLKEKGIEVRFGTYDDLASLDKAMKGIDKVLLVSGSDPNRLKQHINVVDAAKKAGIKHIAYTGISMKNINTSAIKVFLESHFQTENYIKESGLTYTFLRNTLYMDGIPMFTGDKVFESGIYLPAGNGKVPYALRREMGEATANVLLNNGHENKVYEITGNSLSSFGDIANELSLLTNKKISYTDAEASQFASHLTQKGVPEIAAMVVSGFSADIKNDQFELESNHLEKLLGRKPTILKEGLKEIFKL